MTPLTTPEIEWARYVGKDKTATFFSDRDLEAAAELTAIDMAGDDFFAQACDITREHATRILQEKGDRA